MRIDLRHRLISLVVAFLAAVGTAAEINAGVWYGSSVSDERWVVEQDNHYYPYGMLMGESSNILISASKQRLTFTGGLNPYLFGSKEYLTTGGANLLDFTARTYDPTTLLFLTPDPLREKFLSFNAYLYCGSNPINRIDPSGMDWVEDVNGDVTWRDEINKDNYTTMLSEGETYRGVSYTREKIWLDVNVRGNSVSGLMTEYYNPDGKMKYKNNTPWVGIAVKELKKKISETGNNPEILKYFDYTQLKGGVDAKTDATAWCAAFVNYCLETSGINGTNYATAFSFKNWGQSYSTPVFGSIAIMDYSHVGFVIGQNKDGRIILLGGNQKDAVNLSPNSKSNVIKYVYPANSSVSNLPLPRFNFKGRSLNVNNTR